MTQSLWTVKLDRLGVSLNMLHLNSLRMTLCSGGRSVNSPATVPGMLAGDVPQEGACPGRATDAEGMHCPPQTAGDKDGRGVRRAGCQAHTSH